MFSFNDITIGQYRDTRSIVHRLDPRTKFFILIFLMIPILCTQTLYSLTIVSLICMLAILFAKLPATMILRNLRPFLWLFGITCVLHLFLTAGTSIPPFPVKGVNITFEGLERGLFFSFRLAIFIVAAALFSLTTSPTELTDSVEHTLKPLRRFGLPAHELAMIMNIALRFIPTIIEEADRLRKAQLARGAHFCGGLIRRIKALIPLTVPLFLSAFRRADELAIAMEARCYRGGIGRTHFQVRTLSIKDYLTIFFIGILCSSAFVIH
ncbi:MAG: energy-coupling factor transporter transmembrane protein EcfT [Gemmatimonadota bacterium]|nr:MAG: energy-coupling factor transporter transmembrane protein EcfT [Gemmatimonadota bacterium]